jgi:hypothetical protein
VQVKINGSDKDGMTVLASITADGKKLPLLFIAKGRTERVHQTQIGNVEGHWVNHTESGWETESCFIDYLNKLRVAMGSDPFHLICDLYAAHRTDAVKAHARKLEITLHLIPASCTDELQPLDRKIFGVLKAKVKRDFRDAVHQQQVQNRILGVNADVKRTKAEAAQDMVKAWNELSEATTLSAWNIYRTEEGEVDNGDEASFESPSELKEIGESAFRYSGLKSIQIPKNVEKIDKDCFYGCKLLCEITFEGKPQSVRTFLPSSLSILRVPVGMDLSCFKVPESCRIEYF